MKGRFITVEGLEGAGKSTAIEAITTWLKSHGKTFIETREPGGTGLGEGVRALLLDPKQVSVSPIAELLLICAARAQHIAEKIRPALESGTWVVCDRFADATFAYQGGGREIAWHKIEQLAAMVQDGLQPDLTLLLDIDPDEGLSRVDGRGKRDRFEIEESAFFDRVRAAYRRCVREAPERFAVIDAAQSMNEVASEIHAVLASRAQAWR